MDYLQAGAAGDTLTASVTKAYTVKFFNSDRLVYRVGVLTDSVSGTAGYTGLLQGSLDGTTFSNIDTVTVSTSGDTAFYFVNTVGNDFSYLRISLTATATAQKSTIKVIWLFIRKDNN